MIKSITFKPTDNNGDYRNAKAYKRVKVKTSKKRNERRYSRAGDGYDEVEDGYRNLKLRDAILDRTINFSSDKINILFGPNGSGKTTILKCLGAACLCGDDCMDGWTNIKKYSPMDFGLSLNLEDYRFTCGHLMRVMYEKAGVESSVLWDGMPVFYHNLDARMCQGTLEIGGLKGGLFSTLGAEISYRMSSRKSSAGENTLGLLGMLVDALTKAPKIEDLLNYDENTKCMNDIWKDCTGLLVRYLKGLRDNNPGKSKNSILLDEVDKSLDIESVILLYKNILPALLTKMDVQIIAVSHNPIILLEAIRNSEQYNIISMDEEYTARCLELLKNDRF